MKTPSTLRIFKHCFTIVCSEFALTSLTHLKTRPRFCKCMYRSIWYALIRILQCFLDACLIFLTSNKTQTTCCPCTPPLPPEKDIKEKKRNPTWPEFHFTIPLDKVRMQRWIDVVLRYRTILIAHWFLIPSLSAVFFENEQIRGLTRRTWRHTITEYISRICHNYDILKLYNS